MKKNIVILGLSGVILFLLGGIVFSKFNLLENQEKTEIQAAVPNSVDSSNAQEQTQENTEQQTQEQTDEQIQQQAQEQEIANEVTIEGISLLDNQAKTIMAFTTSELNKVVGYNLTISNVSDYGIALSSTDTWLRCGYSEEVADMIVSSISSHENVSHILDKMANEYVSGIKIIHIHNPGKNKIEIGAYD